MTDHVPIREDGLQLDERRGLQRRFWSAQRVAWCVFGLVMVAALAGLTGSGGPFHDALVRDPQAEVRFPRTARWQAPDAIQVVFLGSSSEHRLGLDTRFFESFEIERVLPEPRAALTTSDAQVLVFEAAGSPPHRVEILLRARRPGLARFSIDADGAVSEPSILVLP